MSSSNDLSPKKNVVFKSQVSSSSSDHYDLLADSDCSSAESDTPKNSITTEEMQGLIRNQMRNQVNLDDM